MKEKHYWLLFGILGTSYLFLTATLPTAGQTLTRYDISQKQANILALTVALPLVTIWFVAFLGSTILKNYAENIKKHRDGMAFSNIANGLLVLSLGSVAVAIFTAVLRYWSLNDKNVEATVIISNYANIALFLISFWFIYKGSKRLVAARSYRDLLPQHKGLTTMFMILVAAYMYATLTNPIRTTADNNIRATYYLPDWLILATIIIPQIIVWFLAFSGAYGISLYRQKVNGVIYKESLKLLSFGLITITSSYIFVQFLSRLSVILSKWALKPTLMIIYGLLLVIAIGYLLVILGVRKLRKIEEV